MGAVSKAALFFNSFVATFFLLEERRGMKCERCDDAASPGVEFASGATLQ